MKFVIGRALTILSWDDPVTAFFEKVEKLRHSLGRPSRSDFVQFQFLELNQHLMTMELKVINSFMFYNRYTPAVKYLPVFLCPEGGTM